ncbi:MAG: tRNA pseudouridine(38-40) synthase TruA [Terrimicrobiaceae bacterium]
MRLKLIVAYDGSSFAGWQSQRGGGSIQDALEVAVQAVTGGPVRVHGSGRTDAGVHAVGQCCHIDVTNTRMTPDNWIHALNTKLPHQIRILSAESVDDGFHARFSATGKMYRYHVYCGAVLPPMEYQRAWLVREPMDLSRVKQAGSQFVGRHDFAGFSANRGGPVIDSHRTIRKLTVTTRGRSLYFSVVGDGFLYKMVRMIAGALVDCGRGVLEPEKIQAILDGTAKKSNQVAPAGGLTLVKVLYGPPSGHT